MTRDTVSNDAPKFSDPAFGSYSLTLDTDDAGNIESRACLLVRLTDIRGDESGELPGEKFATASLSRQELHAMLRDLDRDVLETIHYSRRPATQHASECAAELQKAIADHAYATDRLRRVATLAAGWQGKEPPP
ncbi:MAG: hypothetical protein AB7P37_03470 [Ramlibacter sp.]